MKIGKRVIAQIGINQVEVRVIDISSDGKVVIELPDRNTLTLDEKFIKEV